MLKYETVASDLINRITQGSYQANDRLPTVGELAQAYGVSVITVKRALDELDRQGLITRRRGSGTYVKALPSLNSRDGGWSVAGQMAGFMAEHRALGERVGTVVKEFAAEEPPEDIAAQLAMQPGELAYHTVRVRSANDVPQSIEYTYMPLSVIPGLTRAHAEASIYSYITEELGLVIDSAHRRVSSVSANAEQAAWLGVKRGTALLDVTQLGFLADGTPFERSRSLHVPGYELLVISKR